MDYFKGLSTSGIFGTKAEKDNESSTWVIDDEMDDEWLQITVDNEAVLKIKA